MISMTPYDVYRSYLALKLHFTTDQYDVIKQQGRVKTSKQAFFKRKDLFAIKKLSETYDDCEVVNFLVAQIDALYQHRCRDGLNNQEWF